jgi:WhiB family transcriptional regulator, redox-sensing transcriptional regulator
MVCPQSSRVLYLGASTETFVRAGGFMGKLQSYDDRGAVTMWNQDWAAQAACRGQQPDKLFVRGAEQNKAKQVCGACPVRTECLAEALDNQIEWGVWGGMTERERRALLRRRPNASWRVVLETAREQHPGVAVSA